jgi:hypothetical protein
MNKKKQRNLGIILGQLDKTERETITDYIELLEIKLQMLEQKSLYNMKEILRPKKSMKEIANQAVETQSLKTSGRGYGSKYFSEEEIHNKMFNDNYNKVFKNKDGVSYHLTTLSQIIGLKESDYKALRNKAIIDLHNKRYAIQNNA